MKTSLLHGIAGAFAPPPSLTVSEWANANRILPESSAARGGRWRSATTPYLDGIMDSVLEPDVKRIAIQGSAQVGKTSCVENIIGYFIQHRPSPMLLVFPTESDAEEFSKTRLMELVARTPALRAVVREERVTRGKDGGAASTLRLKVYPGGYLALGGSNSPNAFARRAVKLAIGDDVDRWPAVVGDEGDPGELLTARTTTFFDGLVIFMSTPNMRRGRIDTLYTRSDQRKYHVPCPRCGRMDYLTWSDEAHLRVVFEGRDPMTARFECPAPEHGGCGARIWNHQRIAILARGEWRPTAEPTEPGLVGFHLWAGMSPWVSIDEMVTRFFSAREGGAEKLKPFFNTVCGEPWEDRSERMEPHWLWSRREDYGEGVEIPARGVCLTTGVDVQADRAEVLVMAWGPAGERWIVDYGIVPGDLKYPETKESLLGVLRGTYAHASGVQLPIHATCVDSGYNTEEVYAFVLAHQHRRIYATKGIAGRSGEPIVGKPSEKRWGRNPRPVRLYPVNVDDAKAEIRSSLLLVPQPDGAPSPGSMHFPVHDSVNEEFFAQLCAEHRETKYNKGNVATHQVWVLDRPRNEALDGAVLALAAFRLLSPNLHQLAERIRMDAAGQVTAAPTAERTKGWVELRPDWLERSPR